MKKPATLMSWICVILLLIQTGNVYAELALQSNTVYDIKTATLDIPNVQIGNNFYCSISLKRDEQRWNFRLQDPLRVCIGKPSTVTAFYDLPTRTLSLPEVVSKNGQEQKRFVAEMIYLPALDGIQLVLERAWTLEEGQQSKLVYSREKQFPELPANRWVLISESLQNWFRQGHAGATFDTKRNKIYVFGSDTHSQNWDNAIHEFDLTTLEWITHYAPAPEESYRADESGNAIAGTDRLLPWAMHTFDNIIYDPKLDAVIVTARPNHNYKAHEIAPEAVIHPTWIYDLKTRQWSILGDREQTYPDNFGGATAYDSARDAIVTYRKGIFELGPNRMQWQLATEERHHEIHYNLEYDSNMKAFVVFGDFHGPKEGVWVYYPGPRVGTSGRWQQYSPEGDKECHANEALPVAYSTFLGKFLLMPRDHQNNLRIACLYDASTHYFQRIPSADLVTEQKMNYMMVYDPSHQVFLMVTGNWKTPIKVWALKIDETKIYRHDS